jgi:hypothetical protein
MDYKKPLEETKQTEAPSTAEKDVKEEFDQFMTELKKLSNDNNKYTQDYQLNRLTNSEFLNPFDILDLP